MDGISWCNRLDRRHSLVFCGCRSGEPTCLDTRGIVLAAGRDMSEGHCALLRTVCGDSYHNHRCARQVLSSSRSVDSDF